MVVSIGQIGGQRVAVNRIGGDPSQRRLLRWLPRSHPLDLHNQGLIRREIERLVWDDGLAIKNVRWPS